MIDEASKTEKGIPYYNFRVPAGFPSPAMDYLEERIDLNKVFIKHPLSTFLIDCAGTSMIEAFIPPKCKLIIDRSLTAKNGDIVFAVLAGEFTVKYFKKIGDKCWLCPANKAMNDIEITDEMNMQIWGVVTTILITANDLKQCMP
ncbi:LexA family protein [Segetibacter koreensis]|uniref:LexA family protein n=1 Tax=Segetibacter koreensis TaxID=398037 RepID=UPI000367DD16|nr:translesion error-prone DNA polymerase V autoproteolytic subunit [Segetibacter koreensis]